MGNQKYWQGIEELHPDENQAKIANNEFAEELPVIGRFDDNLAKSTTKRRDFLKLLGFSVSAATLAASCKIPVNKSIPYLIKPEEITPGVANYYASTFAEGGDYVSVLVKTREGRPIKIEGNDLSPITKGGTSARSQASILSLYDGSRLQNPLIGTDEKSWNEIDGTIISKLTAESKIRIVSNTVLSPSTKSIIKDWTVKYPNSKHITYDTLSYSGMLQANEKSFGSRVIPSYHFENAEVIVSIGADFLGTWISPVEYTKQYVQNRKISDVTNAKMSRHIQIEAKLSLTGCNADERIQVRASEESIAALRLYNYIKGTSNGNALEDSKENALKEIVAELKSASGKALVISGSNDINTQIIINEINKELGSYGTTIDMETPSYQRQGVDAEMVELIGEMKNGGADVLIIYSCNPVHNHPMGKEFGEALSKMPNSISLNQKADETGKLCKYLCPDSHYLESWNDAEPKRGFFSLGQPAIAPIFETRQAQDSLLKWMAADKDYYHYMQWYWQNNIFPAASLNFQSDWDKVVQDGVHQKSASIISVITGEQAPTAMTSQSNVATITQYDSSDAIDAVAGYKISDQPEVILYEKIGIGDGRYADNPWLQEMPDPVSKVCWDNYLTISEKHADELGLKQILPERMTNTATITLYDKSVELPVIIQPGQSYGTLGIALGYGRTEAGHNAANVGMNVNDWVQYINGTYQYFASGVSITKSGSGYKLAQTQTHHTISSKDDLSKRTVIREMNLGSLSEGLEHLAEERREMEHLYSEMIYPGYDYSQGHHWGLSIDLNSCIGCGACSIACTAENNVPVVGQKEVHRVHEMQWLRIDRYYTGDDSENPGVVFQPMMCQHCDNAPCENVCPASATSHSTEGLNQMAYNRCFGTRYCANNCPYKVRRFNWFDYQGADAFYDNTIFKNKRDKHDMTNDLTRMVLNPDVVVRSRGVMEKCSMCAQKIQAGKLDAKKDNRLLKDGDIKTACQSACPANAITFGDVNDTESYVHKIFGGKVMEKRDPRAYFVIEEVGTKPKVAYLAKVWNKKKTENKTGEHA